MEQAARTPAREPEYESQIRRMQRGVVAGYIHDVSERHRGFSATSGKPGRPDTPLGSNSR
jgi:hypothetical protein